MSVYKPKKGRFWWYDFQQKGHRYTGSTGATTRTKAERVEAAKRVAAAAGELDKPALVIPTLSESAATWWQSKSHLSDADQSLARVTVACELVGKTKPVNEVTFADIQTAIQKRRAMLTPRKTPPSNATVNRDMIATLRPVLKLARKRLNSGVGAAVAFPEIDWGELAMPEPKPKAKGLSGGEVESLVDVVPDNLKEFVRFMRRYGPRISEMFFHPDDVDVEGRRVTFRDRKGGDDHVVPIRADDAAMLAARVSRAKAADLETVWYREVVDPKTKDVKLVARTVRGVGKALSAAVTDAGLRASKGVRGSHVLRHTAGTDILRATGNVRIAQKLLGHASLQSTLVYAHALEDDLRAALDNLSQPAPEPETKDDEKDHDSKRKA